MFCVIWDHFLWGAGAAAAPRWRPGWLPGLMTCTWLPHYLRLSHIPAACTVQTPCLVSSPEVSSFAVNQWTAVTWLGWLGGVSGVFMELPGLFEGFPLFLHCNAKCSWINLLEEGQHGIASFLLVGVDATISRRKRIIAEWIKTFQQQGDQSPRDWKLKAS